MKWQATHIAKIDGEPPRRVMKNSGCYFTRAEWEGSLDARIVENEQGGAEIDSKPISISLIGPTGAGTSKTPLRKKVTRITTDTLIRHKGKLRRLVVSLLPGDVIELNLEGCRRWSTARTESLREAWEHAGKLAAAKLARERRARRKAA